MPQLHLAPEVEAVLRAFRTCECSTLARDGTPITWPTMSFFDEGTGRILVTTSIGLPRKALDVRREPRVALLYSDPTASSLRHPPTVLVQGDAEAPADVVTSIRGSEDALRLVFQRQPASGFYSRNRLTRALFDWYYMRLLITVTPRRVLVWPGGDGAQEPQESVAAYVG